jgi:hypothetical protein
MTERFAMPLRNRSLRFSPARIFDPASFRRVRRAMC